MTRWEPPYLAVYRSGELNDRVEYARRLLAKPCRVCPRQCPVDRLADRCVARALEPVGRMAEEIMRAVERARDLEELREELAELYATLPADEFEDLLARALYAADLYGRWTAIA